MTRKKIENLSFEEAVAELEQIVEQLEQGDLPLEESMKSFERGLKLSRISQTKLTEAEQKIKMLVNNQGSEQLVDFELTDTDS